MARARLSLSLLCIALGATTGCITAPEEGETIGPEDVSAPSTAQEILDRYVAALGGEEAVRALQQRTVEARLTFHADEGCEPGDQGCNPYEAAGSFTLQMTADGRMFRRMIIDPPAEAGGSLPPTISERGFDGELGWELQPGDPPLLVLDDEIAARGSLEDALLHWYLDYDKRQIAPEIQSPRTIEVDGKTIELDGIAWVEREGRLSPRTYWFDRATGLLREEVETDPSLPDVSRTIIYEDYQDIDGTKIPHKIRQISDLQGRISEVSYVVQRVHHKPLQTESWKIPELPAPEPVADERLLALDSLRRDAEKNPGDELSVMGWARAAWAAGHFEEAEKALAAVLKINRREPEALWLLGRIKLMRGDLKGAERNLRAAEKAGAHPAVVAHQAGMLSARRLDFRRAAAAFAVAQELPLAERYQAFEGKPLTMKWGGDGCTVELPLLDGFEAPVVKATLEGEEVNLLVDSSVQDVILDPRTAIKLLISTDAMSQLGGPEAQGGFVVGHGQAETLVLGDLDINQVPVDMYPAELMAEVSAGRAIDGVLGNRVFQQVQVTLDMPNRRLLLVRDTGKCKAKAKAWRTGVSVPYVVHDGYMMFVMGKMNGAEGLFLVNSAMRGAGLAATVGAFARAGVGSPVLRAGQPGAFVEVGAVEVGDLSLGKVTAAWGWAEQGAPDAFRVDGMLGLEAIGPRRWTIDYPNQTFYFDEKTKAAPK